MTTKPKLTLVHKPHEYNPTPSFASLSKEISEHRTEITLYHKNILLCLRNNRDRQQIEELQKGLRKAEASLVDVSMAIECLPQSGTGNPLNKECGSMLQLYSQLDQRLSLERIALLQVEAKRGLFTRVLFAVGLPAGTATSAKVLCGDRPVLIFVATLLASLVGARMAFKKEGTDATGNSYSEKSPEKSRFENAWATCRTLAKKIDRFGSKAKSEKKPEP